ncbi:MAG: hydantoinase/oxoprolinase family protein, partial [Gammaproteobacteria bacterium]|nr:hydantoinase/oxoprolinase family protein [Gammaproteobacteria bacterium]
TTRGFRDVLELRRSTRGDLYDTFQDPPSVLVPRRWRFEVDERVDAEGRVLRALDPASLESLVERLVEIDAQAIAVSLLFSFLNDRHERMLGDFLRARLPDVPVFLSCEVLPEIREFERTSTTAICAYVAPILRSYLRVLDEAVTGLGLPSPYVMGSSGGLLEIDEVLKVPAVVVESGPAAGVIASAMLGRRIERPNQITFDMGGTTAKASLILDHRISTTPEYEVGGHGSGARHVHGTGHPIRIPVVDLAEVSAGGGSIAWIDPAGSLRVGPSSAGAEPGPVCYGRGGEAPTVTDANLVLGRLGADSLLGGGLPVDPARAETALRVRIAEPLGLDVHAAAAAILEIVNNAMADALRTVSIERGHDPREFTLTAFGGAGPLHAAALAEELEMREILIPPATGAFSALGLVGTDVRRDYARTWYRRLDDADPPALEALFQALEREANAMLERTGIAPARRELVRAADVRYLRQAYELSVPLAPGRIDEQLLARLGDDFNDQHLSTYGHANRDEPIQIVTIRVSAIGRLDPLQLTHDAAEGTSLKGRRPVWFDGAGLLDCPVHDKRALAVGTRLQGPMIVESVDSTVVVPPSWTLELMPEGHLLLRAGEF